LCLRRRRLRLRRKGRQQTLLLLELINAPVGLLQLILLRLVVYFNGNDKRQVLQSKQQRFLGILGLSERGFVNITPQIATQTIRMVTRRFPVMNPAECGAVWYPATGVRISRWQTKSSLQQAIVPCITAQPVMQDLEGQTSPRVTKTSQSAAQNCSHST
jgi:hypothetical protein